MIPLIACSVNFSNNADTENRQVALRLAVDPPTRADTKVVKGVAGTDPRCLACLLTSSAHHRVLRAALILPQTVPAQTGVAVLQLPRRDDLVKRSIPPMSLCRVLSEEAISHEFNLWLCSEMHPPGQKWDC